MNLNLRTKETFAELTINVGSVANVKEITTYNYENKKWEIEDDLISNFITIANELSRFNHVSDVDFVKKIIESFLCDSEREELIEFLTNNK